jgi:hypothetical protein
MSLLRHMNTNINIYIYIYIHKTLIPLPQTNKSHANNYSAYYIRASNVHVNCRSFVCGTIVQILLLLFGVNSNLTYSLQKNTSLLVSLKKKLNITGALLCVFGLFISFSKGGIANDQIR